MLTHRPLPPPGLPEPAPWMLDAVARVVVAPEPAATNHRRYGANLSASRARNKAPAPPPMPPTPPLAVRDGEKVKPRWPERPPPDPRNRAEWAALPDMSGKQSGAANTAAAREKAERVPLLCPCGGRTRSEATQPVEGGGTRRRRVCLVCGKRAWSRETWEVGA